MNLVALIGNVASKPELRRTPAGRSVCSFRLAVSRPGADQADFLSVVAWERQAEVCAEYVQVGRRIGVEGRLHHSAWEVEGAKRSKVEVVASRISLLGARQSSVRDSSGVAKDAEGQPAEDHQSVDHNYHSSPTDIPTDTSDTASESSNVLMPA
jgi:single-strand DNA-binding protein